MRDLGRAHPSRMDCQLHALLGDGELKKWSVWFECQEWRSTEPDHMDPYGRELDFILNVRRHKNTLKQSADRSAVGLDSITVALL